MIIPLPGNGQFNTDNQPGVTSIDNVTLHVPLALSRLIEFWKNKPNMAGLVTSYAQEVQLLENAIWDVLVMRTLDYAQGVNLDALGRLVGQDRGSLTDPQYRVRIKARIKINSSFGTAANIIDILRFVDPAPFKYSEGPWRSFRIDYITAPAVPAVASQIPGIVRDARAAAYGCRVFMPAPSVRSLRWASIYDSPVSSTNPYLWGSTYDATAGGVWATVATA